MTLCTNDSSGDASDTVELLPEYPTYTLFHDAAKDLSTKSAHAHVPPGSGNAVRPPLFGISVAVRQLVMS